MQKTNHFSLYIARDAETKELVGYASIFLMPNIFFTGTVFADIFSIYTVPQYRGRGVFTELLSAIEEDLRGRADYIQIGFQHYPGLITKKGYKALDTYFYKKIS